MTALHTARVEGYPGQIQGDTGVLPAGVNRWVFRRIVGAGEEPGIFIRLANAQGQAQLDEFASVLMATVVARKETVPPAHAPSWHLEAQRRA